MHLGFTPHHMHLALLDPIQVHIPKLQVVCEMDFCHDQVDLDQSKTAEVR